MTRDHCVEWSPFQQASGGDGPFEGIYGGRSQGFFHHFRTFLNAHRVEEARCRLVDPSQDGEQMIAIAADSGFASLASFNRVFREVEGRTPTEYRRSRGAPHALRSQPPLSPSEELSSGF